MRNYKTPFTESIQPRDKRGRFKKKRRLPPFFRYTLAIKNLHGSGLTLEDVSRFDAIITVIRIAKRDEIIGSKKSNAIKKKLRKMLHKHLDAELWSWNASANQTIEAYEVEQKSQ